MIAVGRLGQWLRAGPVLTVAAAVVGLLALVRTVGGPFWSQVGVESAGVPSSALELWVLAVFFGTIAVGELNRITLPGARESAPMSLAAAFALAMTSGVGTERPMRFDAFVAIAVTG
ncbi:MAG: hypothetical protein ABI243_15980, partial [Lapillicoccus sp.]